ncbi:ribonuclease E activity regulator RraA [Pseudomonas aeruginosa]|nr:ribonuclease E activity regulator RraA [Pseudomonas aeruginosa]TEL40700.1 RraA family protein [Pseudomonas aeruginosa]TEN16002.1 RraA family protein [Pseudomonas aeruginosa]TEN35973.1 RraA family protein [Pseudomonas aeruginosa]TEP19482.1 RraA family protein [Pseudomonas aeruginosa]TEX56498.1 RraA family protein [Pseudomonas aeruginosa]
MHYVTPDLCDAYPELVQVVEPMFSNFGGRDSFGGEIVTIKCFEDNSLVKEQVDKDGKGKVLVVDGGGSLRRALLGDMLAEKAAKNGWEGIVVYGCIRDVDVIAQTDLGVQALASHPLKTANRQVGAGDLFSLMGHWLQALMIGINNGSPHLAPVSRISAKNASSADKAE